MEPKQVRASKLVLLCSSLATIAALVAAAYHDNFHGEWRDAQRSYRVALVTSASDASSRDAAERFVVEPQQLYLEGLRRIDRCVTCHVGIENPAMADAPLSLRKHSGTTLELHPTSRFGCTICHQGQGRATTRASAHGRSDDGQEIRHAEEPLLRGDAVYTSCGRCHYEVDLYGGQSDLFAGWGGERARPEIDESSLRFDLTGAEILAHGKQLVVDSGCLGCHKYRGAGGELGADLTHIGDKHRHDFDFTHVDGEHTVEQWLYEHFLEPSRVSPDTVMPGYGFTPSEARSITLFMMSLHRKSVPASHAPRPRVPSGGDAEPAGGETLYQMFCSACHGVTGGGDGPAASMLDTRPRDFVREPFRYVSTMEGVATDEDLARTIATGRGIPEMPSQPGFTETEIRRLVEFVRGMRLRGVVRELEEAFADDDDITVDEIQEIALERVAPGDPLVVPAPGADFEASAHLAGRLYADNCASCHGPEGRGDGPQELTDALGHSIRARDLTLGGFRGGAEPVELFKRIRIGIPGTPMPAQEALTDDDVWQLVEFVRGLKSVDRP